eukprot:764771-Hanusia_phi.AAC.4
MALRSCVERGGPPVKRRGNQGWVITIPQGVVLNLSCKTDPVLDSAAGLSIMIQSLSPRPAGPGTVTVSAAVPTIP